MSLLLKSLEPYSFPKGTSREEVCSRLIKPTTQANLDNVGLLTRPLMCGIFLAKHVFNIGRECPTLSKGLWLWYHIKVTWALLIPKRHLKGRGLLKAYKAHNPGKPWQCGTLNIYDGGLCYTHRTSLYSSPFISIHKFYPKATRLPHTHP